MVRILICYASLSGNTKEVAEMIQSRLVREHFQIELYRIDSGMIPDPSQYDAMIVGTYTWDKGSTPEEVKDFVYEIGYKPPNVFVFGTGDTQFGGDLLFCRAAEKIAKFYNSRYKPLKIEQSPRGSQEVRVIDWTEGVIEQCLHCLIK
ncbi:flavodoxin [Bacillus niameyensis]|uniref:flavodoxin n=1 Tax=Bacillus niameyensis TaxID=1522308 RepID=UPI0007824795|nr:flavodoxin [Bacillus niameyensis]